MDLIICTYNSTTVYKESSLIDIEETMKSLKAASATKNNTCWFRVYLVTGQNTSEWMEEFVTLQDAYKYMASLPPAQYFIAVSGPGWRRGLIELKESW